MEVAAGMDADGTITARPELLQTLSDDLGIKPVFKTRPWGCDDLFGSMLSGYFEHGNTLVEIERPIVQSPENVGTEVHQRLRWRIRLGHSVPA